MVVFPGVPLSCQFLEGGYHFKPQARKNLPNPQKEGHDFRSSSTQVALELESLQKSGLDRHAAVAGWCSLWRNG